MFNHFPLNLILSLQYNPAFILFFPFLSRLFPAMSCPCDSRNEHKHRRACWCTLESMIKVEQHMIQCYKGLPGHSQFQLLVARIVKIEVIDQLL